MSRKRVEQLDTLKEHVFLNMFLQSSSIYADCNEHEIVLYFHVLKAVRFYFVVSHYFKNKSIITIPPYEARYRPDENFSDLKTYLESFGHKIPYFGGNFDMSIYKSSPMRVVGFWLADLGLKHRRCGNSIQNRYAITRESVLEALKQTNRVNNVLFTYY